MRTLVSAVGAIGALGIAACQSLTSVDAPDVVEAGDYNTPGGASALAAGGTTRFHLAFGGREGQVRRSGEIADELVRTSSFLSTDDASSWDTRDPAPLPSGRLYAALHDARQPLLSAITFFHRAAPDSTARIGQLFALLGYTSIFLGENFCAGVPLSHRDADLRPVYGRPLTTAQLFDSALTALDSALIYGADSARIANLARVGRGRALLNLGRFSEAAQAVAAVPTAYVYNVTFFATDALSNGFFRASSGFETGITIPDGEGANGINWRTAAGTTWDPRTPLIDRQQVIGGVQSWGFAPYQASTAPIRLGGGVEARLIEAEAALQTGDTATWLGIHNTLRATAITPAMTALADPGSLGARVDLHFRERAFWLFLTGHRHGDLRRLVRQYGRAPETVFPTGIWRDGIPYGTATNMAPPLTQLNNPNYTGCLNRDA